MNTEDGPAEIGSVAISAPITGPERSVTTEAVTTNAAANAMRRASVRTKASSGDMLAVVPANAGTHTPRLIDFGQCGSILPAPRNVGGYGSLRSQGRRAIIAPHTRFIDTETFGPFLMVW